MYLLLVLLSRQLLLLLFSLPCMILGSLFFAFLDNAMIRYYIATVFFFFRLFGAGAIV
jgi:hypothetical protein